MKNLKITVNTDNQGLDVVLKDYQAVAMRLLWEGGEYSSRDVWDEVNNRLVGKTISRASVINFLNASVDDGVLNYRETTGKGGHRRIYSAAKTEEEFWHWLIRTVDNKLAEASGLYHRGM